MPHWEHKIIRADWFGKGLHAMGPDLAKPIPLVPYLDELGSEGWEAVAMQMAPMVTEVGKLIILLKRMRE